MSKPASFSELYPSRWVKADDLNGKAVTVKVAAVTVEEFHIPQSNESKMAAVLAFEGKSKRLILNKTMAGAMVQITGSETFSDWIGHTVTLTPAKAPNGKATVQIRAGGNGVSGK